MEEAEEEEAEEGGGTTDSNDNLEHLYNAVGADDEARLRQLLTDGADPDTFYQDDANISSKSILHIACGKGRTECVKALLEAGAMPDIHDTWGQTPLHYCITVQFLDTAQVLLEHLGDRASDIINNQDSFGKSCLHAAADCASLEAMELLIKHGADVNIRNFEGVTPLMVCAESSYGRLDSVRAMKLLITSGALINIADYRSRRSVLQRAAVAKNVAAVELLLASGVEVDALDVTQRTPLTNLMWDHVRNRQGVCDIDSDVMTIIVLLIQGGADLDLAVCEYSNPLVTSAFLQAAPLLRFFLDQGAQPNVTFRSGITPLLIATSKKDANCVKVLLSYNCCMTTKGRVFRRRKDMEFTFDPVELALDDGSFHLVHLFLAAGYNAGSIHSQLMEKLKSGGDSAPGVDAELRGSLLSRVTQPCGLQQLSIYAVRAQLGQRLHKAVPLLPLPARVRESLMLEHLLT